MYIHSKVTGLRIACYRHVERRRVILSAALHTFSHVTCVNRRQVVFLQGKQSRDSRESRSDRPEERHAPCLLASVLVYFFMLGGIEGQLGTMQAQGGKARFPEHLFTRSPGPLSSACMSCTRRTGWSSVFDQQKKPRGWPGYARRPPLPSTAKEARSMSTWRRGHAGVRTGMPTIPKRAAPASAISDKRKTSRWRG